MIILLILFFSFNSAFSVELFEQEAVAVVRDKKFNARKTNVILKNLIASDRFDGLYFKIVKAKSTEAIEFSEADEKIQLKAATTYYHLNRARDYFINVLKSDYVKSLPKIVVRIDITNQFNELGHFAHDNLNPQFNNALTIPAGKGLPGRGIKPWDMEIWFAPSKKIHISELKVKGSPQDFQVILKQFRNQTHMTTFQRFMAQILNNQMQSFTPSFDNIFKMVGTSIIFELAYLAAEPLGELLSRKWFHLETALIPEIIYHEFSHAALSDKLELSHSSPVIEGMADFFAGKISNSKKLATKIKKYNTYSGKKAKKKEMYQGQFETSEYANADFVFGLLWNLESIFGQEETPYFIYELRHKINTNSSVRGQLVQGLLDVCDENCLSPVVDRMKLLREFNRKGI